MSDSDSTAADATLAPILRSVEEAHLRLETLQRAYHDLMQKLVEDGQNTAIDLKKKEDFARKQMNDRLSPELEAQVEKREQAGFKVGEQLGFEKGHAEGKQKGLEESRRSFDQQVQQKAQELVDQSCGTLKKTLSNIIEDFNRTRIVTIEETRRDTVKLARGIAEKVVRREIESLPMLVVENIELAVQRIGDRSQIIIEVNPSDLAGVIQFLPALQKKLEGCEGAEVIGLDSICAGGCRVKSRSSSVDLTVGTQLDLIELALIQDKQES